MVCEEKLSRRFLGYYLRTPEFRQQVEAQGSTNYAAIRPGHVLEYEVPLPPLDEQQRIVAYLDALSAKITQARTLRQQATEEATACLPAVLHRTFVSDDTPWPWATVEDAAEIIDPNPSHRMPRYAESGIPFISTVDFEGAEGIRRRTAKYVADSTYREQLDRCKFAPGDILYSRIGTIGAARELTDVWPFALSHVLVVVKPKADVVSRFLLWYLRSDSIVTQAADASRSVGVPDLGIKRIRAFRMPFPTLADQRRIVDELDALQAKIEALKLAQAETAAELDALQSAALDRAFKGEL
ncbi:MAG: restriction endonuclease subunit S [Planctomycetes bacterium]|nr:restriction endonuclease subunit S [Planctomycetota bacterium]